MFFISCICCCCASFISSNSCIHSSDVAPGPLPNIAPQPVLDVCFDAVLVSLHVLLLLFCLHMLHLLLIVFDAVLVASHFKVPPKLCCQVGRPFGSAPPTGLASCVKCILMCFVVGTCNVHFITRRLFIKALAEPDCPDSLCNIKC